MPGIPRVTDQVGSACYHTNMDDEFGLGSHPSELVPTSANSFGEWLSVSEAVVFCEQNGLSRTPKTVRKWALRSFQYPDNSDLTARREDVDNGFRWVIQRASLLRKIEQELEFEARRKYADVSPSDGAAADASEPARTGANQMDDELASVSLAEHVQTGANPSAPVRGGAPAQPGHGSDDGTDEQVRTSANRNEQLREQVAVVQQLQARIEDLKSEVEFYRDELKDRRHTTLALTDVIEAFRLTAATNASKAQERSERRSHDIRPNGQGDSWSSENTGDDVY